MGCRAGKLVRPFNIKLVYDYMEMSMENPIVSIVKGEAVYPSEKWCYSPSVMYPEYPFSDISPENNTSYEMVRESLVQLGYDKENFGTEKWNPLSEIIHEGDSVLVKPNWVMHINKEIHNHSMECMVTHPSVLRATLDYVLLALKGTGKVTVADAPVQECDFEILQEAMHYREIQRYYQEKGIIIDFVDMRGCVVTQTPLGQFVIKRNIDDGRIVNLREKSHFEDLDEDRIDRLRITRYPTKELKKHHEVGKHEYSIHPLVLDAQVIINLPKPKAHRKAGMTACLKNMVGTCVRKEYLPHHTVGSKQENGDEYLKKSIFLRISAWCLDRKNDFERNNKCISFFYRCVYKTTRILGGKDQYAEGSWYGNDTIWRTILDLNTIIQYCDCGGGIQCKPQRRIFSIADMVISGEKEGPLLPSPKRIGVLVAGESPAANDYIISKIFGFSAQKIPYLNYLIQKQKLEPNKIHVIWGGTAPQFDTAWKIEPASNWKGHIEEQEVLD